MFKSCCARPTKKINKSKSATEKMDLLNESTVEAKSQSVSKDVECTKTSNAIKKTSSDVTYSDENKKVNESQEPPSTNSERKVANDKNPSENKKDVVQINDPSPEECVEQDTLKDDPKKFDLTKKRYSVDFKRARSDFKRYSVDLRRDTETLQELERLELELTKTNVDVRPGRRKSTGILKSTTSSCDVNEHRSVYKEESESGDDEVFAAAVTTERESDGPCEPPVTPVGRDELALRRHRFVSDLVCAARAAVEHRVRFDPLGPMVADTGDIPFLLFCRSLDV